MVNADPGFDYIFSRDIKGVVTKYGGRFSHLSLRCEYFDLPAIIGCGDSLFREMCDASSLFIDCKSRIIRVND